MEKDSVERAGRIIADIFVALLVIYFCAAYLGILHG